MSADNFVISLSKNKLASPRQGIKSIANKSKCLSMEKQPYSRWKGSKKNPGYEDPLDKGKKKDCQLTPNEVYEFNSLFSLMNCYIRLRIYWHHSTHKITF